MGFFIDISGKNMKIWVIGYRLWVMGYFSAALFRKFVDFTKDYFYNLVMRSPESVYDNVLELASHLSIEEQARLVAELRDKTEGFGMWRYRPDLKDPEEYLLKLRESMSKHPGGSPKTPEEFLKELEEWNE